MCGESWRVAMPHCQVTLMSLKKRQLAKTHLKPACAIYEMRLPVQQIMTFADVYTKGRKDHRAGTNGLADAP